MRADLFVYLSGPLTATLGYTVEDNIASALRTYWALLLRGVPAFCPHLAGAFPTAWTLMPREQWLAYDYRVIERATHVLMLPRWETSAGAVDEKTYAEARGLPVVYSIGELLGDEAPEPA
jgi:hypothetical protein